LPQQGGGEGGSVATVNESLFTGALESEGRKEGRNKANRGPQAVMRDRQYYLLFLKSLSEHPI